jgi:methyl-accepting chemotaxis protein
LQKFLLIFILFIVPLVSVSAFLFINANKQIQSTRKEMAGIEYNPAVLKLAQHIQQHRGIMSNYIGGKNVTDQLKAKEKEIQEDIQAIDALDSKYGKLLRSTEKWTQAKNGVSQLLKDELSFKLDESLQRHADLVGVMFGFTSYIGDQSQLRMEPSIDLYYMIDASMYKLPALTETMGKTRALGVGILAQKSITADQQNQMILYVPSIQENVAATEYGRDIVYQTNPAVKDELDKYNTEAIDSAKKLQNATTDNIVKATSFTADSGAYYDLATAAINQVFVLIYAEADVVHQLFAKRVADNTHLLYTIAGLALLFIAVIVYLFIGFYRSIKLAVGSLTAATQSLAEGNLTVRVDLKTRDETSRIGEAFNRMAEAFQRIIIENNRISEQTALAARELKEITEESVESMHHNRNAVQQLLHGSEIQLQGASECMLAMQEMAAGVQRMAITYADVSEAAAHAADEAVEGEESLGNAMRQVESIHQAASTSASNFKLLEQHSFEIVTIIEVIREISNQTNLLSLNASIEAARAGEQGRGFAVVANEVKKLAEQSKASADQVANLIQLIQQAVTQTKLAMDQGVSEANKGITAIHSAGGVLKNILSSVKIVANEIQEISAASQQMSAGTEQVTASLEEVVRITKNGVNEIQTVSESIQDQENRMGKIASSSDALYDASRSSQEIANRFRV